MNALTYAARLAVTDVTSFTLSTTANKIAVAITAGKAVESAGVHKDSQRFALRMITSSEGAPKRR